MESLYPMMAGFLAGTVSTTLLLPLDVVKVRLQVHEGVVKPTTTATTAATTATTTAKTTGTTSSTSSVQPPSSTTTTHHHRKLGALRVARAILKYEGISGLYVGLSPAVIGSAVSWGGYFYVYEGLKKYWLQVKKRRDVIRREAIQSNNNDHDDNDDEDNPRTTSGGGVVVALNGLDHFVLSCVAGGVMVGLTNPIWLIKTRMQLQMKRASEQHNVRPYMGILDAFSTIVRNEGPAALYRGSGAALLLTSNGGIQFVVYEYLRKHYHIRQAKQLQEGDSIWERFSKSLGYMTIGATSKIIASTVTYPLQVAKSRMQQRAQALELTEEGQVHLVQRKYGGLLETFSRIAQSEGITGLFKGCVPNALRVAPNAAVTFVVYELTMDLLSKSSPLS